MDSRGRAFGELFFPLPRRGRGKKHVESRAEMALPKMACHFRQSHLWSDKKTRGTDRRSVPKGIFLPIFFFREKIPLGTDLKSLFFFPVVSCGFDTFFFFSRAEPGKRKKKYRNRRKRSSALENRPLGSWSLIGCPCDFRRETPGPPKIAP